MNKSTVNIAIQEVAEKLGIEVVSNKMARCFNKNFHKNGDEHPSLSFINNKSFKCFACGIHGNIFELIKQYENIEYPLAVDWLNNNFGDLVLPKDYNRVEKLTLGYKEKTQILTDFINLCGAPSKEALEYFRNRGLSAGVIYWFQLTDIKNDTLKKLKRKYNDEVLEAVGLLSNGYFVFEKHSLLIPYISSDVIYFIKARSLENNLKSKYLGLKSTVDFPYNVDILLHPDISKEHVFICEGEIDCLTLLDQQLNAIAIPGINGFKEEWVQYFKEFDMIPVIAFDNDEMGKQGAHKLQKLFSDHGIGSKIKHPQEKDWNTEKWIRNN